MKNAFLILSICLLIFMVACSQPSSKQENTTPTIPNGQTPANKGNSGTTTSPIAESPVKENPLPANSNESFLKVKCDLYEATLQEFGPFSPENAALIWAKGVKTRNGVMQYSVLTGDLKKQFKQERDNSSWVTGVSSPWVTKYSIVASKEIDKQTFQITVQFEWGLNGPPPDPTQKTLTIIKVGQYWFISVIK